MYKYLVISGGGIKGITYVGSLLILNKLNILKNIKEYIGSSVGALLCALLNIGYNVNELKQILNIDFSKYLNINILQLFSKLGVDNGNTITKLIKSIIKQKVDPNITFIKLFKLTNKKLTITGSCLNDGEIYYFNYINNPNMKIINALRISISFVGYFEPVIYKNKLFIDGSFYSPCPANFYKNEINKVLILRCKSEYKTSDTKKLLIFKNYIFKFIENLKKRYLDLNYNEYKNNTIILNDSTFAMNFDLSNKIKKQMFNIGQKDTLLFIMKNYNRYLLSLAFNKLKNNDK